MSKTLYKKLIEYEHSGIYPFCMPGHKRRFKIHKIDNPYKIDITEVDGFDNLHDPHGIIKDIEDKLSEIYNVPNVLLSVNGSSAGMLAAITAIQGNVIVARNCHKSVFDAVSINKKKVYYLYPRTLDKEKTIYGGVSPKEVEGLLERHPDIKSVVITSPTYEGFISDIKRIAEVVHAHDAILVVDEAHGAHLPFCKDFPKSAIYLGADIVVQSLHKTLPSLNQTALVFVNNQDLEMAVRRSLSAFTTTSPSYMLLASAEYCVRWCNENEKKFEEYVKLLNKYRKKYLKLKNIHLIAKEQVRGHADIYDVDPSKLVFVAEKMTGVALSHFLLHERKIQMEMAGLKHVIGMTSVMDTESGFARLNRALKKADLLLEYNPRRSASKEDLEKIALLHAFEIGKEYNDFIYVYPPGCPIVAPGEVYSDKDREHIIKCINEGLEVMLWERFSS